MRTSNPALNEKVFQQARSAPAATEAGWAAAQDAYAKPAYRGPVTGDDTMTINGVVWASSALIVLVVAAGIFGWNSAEASETSIQIPGWLPWVAIGALGVAVLTIFKANLARFTAPVYALLEGAVLGAISNLYNDQYDGIVVQAIGLTIGVFLVMLFLYATRVIRVTDKLRMGIVAATGGVLLVYLASFVFRLFGAELPFLHSNGLIGIGISLVIVGIAAFNLLLDFDFVERGVEVGAPRKMEWYAAFGLLVTLVWLYLELLRLLAKLQSRD